MSSRHGPAATLSPPVLATGRFAYEDWPPAGRPVLEQQAGQGSTGRQCPRWRPTTAASVGAPGIVEDAGRLRCSPGLYGVFPHLRRRQLEPSEEEDGGLAFRGSSGYVQSIGAPGLPANPRRRHIELWLTCSLIRTEYEVRSRSKPTSGTETHGLGRSSSGAVWDPCARPVLSRKTRWNYDQRAEPVSWAFANQEARKCRAHDATGNQGSRDNQGAGTKTKPMGRRSSRRGS